MVRQTFTALLGALLLVLPAATGQAQTVTLLTETFDASLGVMLPDNDGSNTDWHWLDDCPANMSMGHSMLGAARWGQQDNCSFYGADAAGTTDHLDTPALDLSLCTADVTVSFNYLLDFNEAGFFDRAQVDIFVDDAGMLMPLRAAGNFDNQGGTGLLTIGGIPPNINKNWTAASINLSSGGLFMLPAGSLVVRFTGAVDDDLFNTGNGFYIDDLLVTCSNLIFADGFESGDTSMWGLTVDGAP